MINEKLFRNTNKYFFIALFFVLCFSKVNAQKWVGTWSTAPQLVETGNMPPSPGLTNNSLRQVVRVSIGGDTVRLRLSNEFSTSSVTLKSVQIALSTGGNAIDVATNKELKFNGSAEVVMAAGALITSDPIAFKISPRTDVAITIYYGQTSTTTTGHPGSRTTSYIISGNTTTVTDFTGAVTTDHWYNINAIDVKTDANYASIAILGNSITDGRGSTTNSQNRWPDILSERLTANKATKGVGVLNMGIGGNCVVAGGLGPTGTNRFDRDILNQAGIRWAVIFIGVNDIGGVSTSSAATTTANNLIAAFKQFIKKAHSNNIRIYGATILPFNGNSYYNQYSDICRTTVNYWIRNSGLFDKVIDFDKAVRDQTDTTKLSLATYQNDGLHPDAAGYQTMGGLIDMNLFTGSDTIYPPIINLKSESHWFEAECYAKTVTNFDIIDDATASNSKYITVKSGLNSASSAPTDAASNIYLPFTINSDSTFNLYALVNCPTANDDSYWVKLDNGSYVMCNNLYNSGWTWTKLSTYQLAKGEHTIAIAYREDGAKLDKICVTNNEEAPTDKGLDVSDACKETRIDRIETINGNSLGNCYPNPFHKQTTIPFEISKTTFVSMKIYSQEGKEIVELAGKMYQAGARNVVFNTGKIQPGIYFYKMKIDNYTFCRKMIIQ